MAHMISVVGDKLIIHVSHMATNNETHTHTPLILCIIIIADEPRPIRLLVARDMEGTAARRSCRSSTPWSATSLPPPLVVLSVSLLLSSLTSLSRSEIDCSTWITVNQSADTAVECGAVTGNLANKTCSNFQDVLLSLTHNRTVSSDCIDVSVHQGDYVISEFINISQNLKLNAEGNVTVRFNFSEKFDASNTNEPHYVLSFINIDRVELNGFDFTESPGIITMVSVNTIVIEDCSFR